MKVLYMDTCATPVASGGGCLNNTQFKQYNNKGGSFLLVAIWRLGGGV